MLEPKPIADYISRESLTQLLNQRRYERDLLDANIETVRSAEKELIEFLAQPNFPYRVIEDWAGDFVKLLAAHWNAEEFLLTWTGKNGFLMPIASTGGQDKRLFELAEECFIMGEMLHFNLSNNQSLKVTGASELPANYQFYTLPLYDERDNPIGVLSFGGKSLATVLESFNLIRPALVRSLSRRREEVFSQLYFERIFTAILKHHFPLEILERIEMQAERIAHQKQLSATENWVLAWHLKTRDLDDGLWRGGLARWREKNNAHDLDLVWLLGALRNEKMRTPQDFPRVLKSVVAKAR
jgi:hypothetical protein